MLNTIEFVFGSDVRIVLQTQEPLESLNYLSKVEKKIITNRSTFLLGYEVLDSVLLDIQNSCINLLREDSSIHNFFEYVGIGFYYNIFTFNVYHNSFGSVFPYMEEDLSIKYHMISGENYLTCYYTKDHMPRIELIPMYPNLNDPDIVAFRNWLSNYKPLIVSSVSLDKCESVNEKIDSIYKNYLMK
jgi:hypothetical protein